MADISIDRLADAITQAFEEYTEDVSEAIGEETESTADKVLREIKESHPYKDRSGKYTKGFVKTNKSQSLPGNRRYVIWNKKYYNLVHLLEKGHAKRGGGRVKAYPHMGPAHDKHVPQFEQSVKKIIRDGG